MGILIRRLWRSDGSIRRVIRGGGRHGRNESIVAQEQEAFLKPAVSTDMLLERSSSSDAPPGDHIGMTSSLADVVSSPVEGSLNVRETAKLSLEFCILWVRPISTSYRCLHADEQQFAVRFSDAPPLE